jgi:tetratricopeptide (TPR) repeat protein
MTAASPVETRSAGAPGPHPKAAGTFAFFGLIALVLLAYGNHFQNAFHFDDMHAVTDNVYIRDARNIPLFFKDARTSSTLPANRSWRPIVTTSLAIDYRLGHGLKPLWFHISTFVWFVAQLGLMVLLFRATFDRARTSPMNLWVAFLATALYGVHPAIAETVNYVIQRADLYSTLGVVAGLVSWIQFPALRKTGLYLIPVVLGILSKAPAAVFPALLFLWIWLCEEEDFKPALLRSIPAFVVSGAAALAVTWMTPSTYVAGASSVWGYRMTQPAVLMGYFRKFFLPLDLSADTDRIPLTNLFTVDGVEGVLFLAAVAGIVWWCRKRRELRPIAFGLLWFLIASIPTSVIALAEVENDHRMFMPFVGLTLSVAWSAVLFIERRGIRAAVAVPVCALVIAGFAAGARARNKVWATEESLWHDVTIKSPNNGRGLMNYGLSLMAKGSVADALTYFQRALVLNPNYYILEINLGIANTTLGNFAEGERHFLRSIQLAPDDASARYFYARWLAGVNRRPEAILHLETAVRSNPDYADARYLLMDTYAASGDAAGLRREAQDTLARFPGDTAAAGWLARAANLPPAAPPQAVTPAPIPVAPQITADAYVAQSLAFFRAGKYPESIAAAQQALKLRPDYAEAWNNIGAAHNQMSQWDQGIAAEQQALRLKPGLEIARNNLVWALSQKQKPPQPGNEPPR